MFAAQRSFLYVDVTLIIYPSLILISIFCPPPCVIWLLLSMMMSPPIIKEEIWKSEWEECFDSYDMMIDAVAYVHFRCPPRRCAVEASMSSLRCSAMPITFIFKDYLPPWLFAHIIDFRHYFRRHLRFAIIFAMPHYLIISLFESPALMTIMPPLCCFDYAVAISTICLLSPLMPDAHDLRRYVYLRSFAPTASLMLRCSFWCWCPFFMPCW